MKSGWRYQTFLHETRLQLCISCWRRRGWARLDVIFCSVARNHVYLDECLSSPPNFCFLHRHCVLPAAKLNNLFRWLDTSCSSGIPVLWENGEFCQYTDMRIAFYTYFSCNILINFCFCNDILALKIWFIAFKCERKWIHQISITAFCKIHSPSIFIHLFSYISLLSRHWFSFVACYVIILTLLMKQHFTIFCIHVTNDVFFSFNLYFVLISCRFSSLQV